MYFQLFIVALLTYVSVTNGEPPKWRTNSRFRQLQRLEAPPAQSQWKPSSAPQAAYGPPTPAPSYGPPPTPAASYGPPPMPAASYGPPPAPSYGPPQEEPSLTTTETQEGTTEVANTTEANAELIAQTGRLLNRPQGSYYIYHPSGLLQKVTYVKNDDAKKMSLDVKLKYENVDPIRGPVYTYDPESLVFQKVFK
ncbi:unnamed protein product [Ceutorhynchus assimilis]|uniref:Uncharacterized protein n=1 Tax=Ceutorhynchus assimilis TaxID=467358 RepID=A0A9N9MS29_9CUCU|nr:unnamed protein product [Ceutorhynchus assimilis]